MLSAEKVSQESMRSDLRPNWTLFAKVNQHMEPVLFREKFLDWPDDAKLIRVKTQAQEDSKACCLPLQEAFYAVPMAHLAGINFASTLCIAGTTSSV